MFRRHVPWCRLPATLLTDMYIIGGVDDQINFLVWAVVSRVPNFTSLLSYNTYHAMFDGLVRPLSSSQPILAFILTFLLKLFGLPVFNTFVICSVLFAFGISALFFRKYKSWFFSAALFAFSSYTFTHLGKHVDLIQIWLVPAAVGLIMRLEYSRTVKNLFFIVTLIIASVFISNYLSYFIFLFFLSYLFARLLVRRNEKKSFIWLASALLVSALISRSILTHYTRADYSVLPMSNAPIHPVEDFVTFSSRPWYFFLASPKNPFLGHISQTVLDKLASTNYFLTQNYFANEHPESYFGLMLLATVLVFGIKAYKRADLATRKFMLHFALTTMILISFMMPPFFTIAGLKIYTPNFLLFKFFPMFRVTARLGIVILLCLLLILVKSVDVLTQSEKWKKFLRIYMPILLVVTLMETYIPIKLYKVPSAPQVYEYLHQSLTPATTFAVYPYSETQMALFWLPVHQQYLLNPRYYATSKYSSESLTKQLATPSGLGELKFLGSQYLVVFKNASPADISFFEKSATLELVQEFDDAYLYKLK